MSTLRERLSTLLFPIFFGLSGICAFTILGLWQIDRLAWKTDLIERLNTAPTVTPIPIEDVNEMNYAQHLFKRVNITGTWRRESIFYVIGKTYQKRLGYHLMNILKLPSGDYLLVNLGWVPDKDHKQGHFQDTFMGRMRMEEPYARSFLPSHKPDLEEWSYVDTKAMGNVLGIKLLPFYVDRVDADARHTPYPVEIQLTLRNPHLQYALTWFSFALVWALGSIFLVRHAWIKASSSRCAILKS